jgi:single-stranded DNA-binding protein
MKPEWPVGSCFDRRGRTAERRGTVSGTFVLVAGTLIRPPEQRTAKNGKPFVSATIRVKDADESQWWKVLAFSENAQAELMRLTSGDAISVQGASQS